MTDTQIRRWCDTCGRVTPTFMFANHEYCQVCEPNGPDDGDDDEEY